MKVVKKIISVILCFALFIVVFVFSAFNKFTSLMGISGSGYTLQGETVDMTLDENGITKEIIQVAYIKNDGTIENRPIILYKPKDAKGDIPLVYVPHYAIEENSADFQAYIEHGWAAASPTEFSNDYNGQLVTDDLVFNNAVLYTLRNMEGIDRQRIAIVGGSAGGYMAMMLSELQMGTCASIANSPITNVYFNFAVHFKNCDEVNRKSGAFDFPITVQGMVSKLFRPINDNFTDENDPRWAALSPIGIAKCVSSPVVVNHYTGDILVPVDQITKKYTYTEHDGSFPNDFSARMADDYPGILSHSLEEEANSYELFIQKIVLENNHINMDMPYTGKLLSINIFDDGPVSAKGSHTAPSTNGSMDIIPYLENMFSKGVAETEKAIPEKLLLLLKRYQGKSVQLPAHVNSDDNVYGSLTMYQKEVVEELTQYVTDHSLDELDQIVQKAIMEDNNEASLRATWDEIKSKM